jgi:exosortase E/protease (VPEID-CTERM system)
VHLIGVALFLYPLLLVPRTDPDLFFLRSLPAWLGGASMGAVGLLLWLASFDRWTGWLSREKFAPLLVVFLAFLVPDLASLIAPLWDWGTLTFVTFAAVGQILAYGGAEAFVDPGGYVIGVGEFYVQIGQPCSGVEGFVLTACFVALYGVLFRSDLRFPQYWLVVLPLGLAASWALNVLRIAALVLIGAGGSPEIAVNGFHSYAGWMFFTLLALALIGLVHATPKLHARPVPASGARLREDWLAARTLPFAVFLATGTVGAALTVHGDLAFPFRALALAAVLGVFWRHLRGLRWSSDPVALLAGGAVGVLWIAVGQPSEDGHLLREALAGLGPVAFASWVLLRVLGTVALVPVAEELFFRGYLLARLDLGGPVGRAFAIAVSSGLFALLHGRWMEAWIAGVIFALVMLRKNRLGDAMLAHMAANGLIVLSAVVRGDWTLI